MFAGGVLRHATRVMQPVSPTRKAGASPRATPPRSPAASNSIASPSQSPVPPSKPAGYSTEKSAVSGHDTPSSEKSAQESTSEIPTIRSPEIASVPSTPIHTRRSTSKTSPKTSGFTSAPSSPTLSSQYLSKPLSKRSQAIYDPSLSGLSDELILAILRFLDFKSLLVMLCVNRRLRSIACDNALWRERYLLHFSYHKHTADTAMPTNASPNFCEMFISCTLQERGKKAFAQLRVPTSPVSGVDKNAATPVSPLSASLSSLSSLIDRFWRGGNKAPQAVFECNYMRVPRQPNEADHQVVILGYSGSGKTSIVRRLVTAQSPGKPEPTVGAIFHSVKMVVDNPTAMCRFGMWDTSGQEVYRALGAMHVKTASAVLVVYDVTREETVDMAKWWIGEVLATCSALTAANGSTPPPVVCLVGNKNDVPDNKREITVQDAKQYAESQGVEWFEVSAKTGAGIVEMFKEISRMCCKRFTPGFQQMHRRYAVEDGEVHPA